jgi:hypothetical protein
MSKNGNIKSFFKPLSQPKTPQSSGSSLSSLPSSPAPAQSQQMTLGTPVKVQAAAASRNFEIKCSDEEEDDDSDGSLEELSVMLGRSVAKAPHRTGANPCVTPKAKRTAIGIHSSPLAFMPKHTFDMQTLVNHALKDNATEESSKMAEDEKPQETAEPFDISEERKAAMRDTLLSTKGPDQQADVDKVLRAMERTEATVTKLRFYFFQRSESASITVGSPFPQGIKTKPWNLLADKSSREQLIRSGMPYAVASKMKELPDALFHWTMDEICTERSCFLRREYIRIVVPCAEQIRHRVSAGRLQQLFLRIGIHTEVKDFKGKLHPVPEAPDLYAGRDWSSLIDFLGLLSAIASNLDMAAITYAVKMLLRMAVDRVVIDNTDIMVAYRKAFQSMISLPIPSWSSFVSSI